MYSHEIVKDYNLTLKYVRYHILRKPNILRKPKTQFWKIVVVGKSRERKKVDSGSLSNISCRTAEGNKVYSGWQFHMPHTNKYIELKNRLIHV